MPYYRWRGVKIDASWCSGTVFARDEQSLRNVLLERNIALVACAQKFYISIRPISLEQKLAFFEQLSMLVSSGVHVVQSLDILVRESGDPRLAQCIDAIVQRVQEGVPLSDAFYAYAHIFSYQMVHTIEVGVQSDNLPVALDLLCHALRSSQDFLKKVRSALVMPVITSATFCIIAMIVLFFIVPRYAALFESMSRELPWITRWLLVLSSYLSGFTLLVVLCFFLVLFFLCRSLWQQKYIRIIFDAKVYNCVLLGPILRHVTLVRFLHALVLLLKGGVQLVPALVIAHGAEPNTFFKNIVWSIKCDIESGKDLSVAVQPYVEFFPQDIVLLITLGQETGNLSRMLERAAGMYQQRVEKSLYYCTTLLQPMLMIILGLLVAGLICSVYMPLFHLADVTL